MAGTGNIKKMFLLGKKSKKRKRAPILKKVENYKEILIVSNKSKRLLSDELTAVFPKAKLSFLYAREEKEDKSKSNDFSYHKSDINLTGKIKNEKLIHLIHIEFDLVLDLSTEDELNSFFLKKLKQSFIIGEKGNSKSKMYDLITQNNNNDSEFILTIKQQITLLSQDGRK